MKDTFSVHKWNKKRYLAENKIEEAAPVELPVIPDSILNKFANQIKTPMTFASAIIALINKLAEKENPNILKNPKLQVVLDKLGQLAQEEPKGEVDEINDMEEGSQDSGPFRGRVAGKPKRIKTKVDTYAGDGIKENNLDENLKDKAKEALRKIQTVAKEKGQNVKSFLKDADGMEIMSALFPGLTAASSFMEEEKNDKI